MNKKQGHEKRTHPQIHYTFPLSLLPCLTVELFIAFHSTSPPSVAIMSILSEGLLFVLGPGPRALTGSSGEGLHCAGVCTCLCV